MASNVVSDNFETSSGGVPQLGGTGATTCKAWVNFNGIGTVAIRDSYNVSSITDNGTGDYTVNFSNNMANANYAAVASGNENDSGTAARAVNTPAFASNSTSAFRIGATDDGNAAYDFGFVTAVVFGD